MKKILCFFLLPVFTLQVGAQMAFTALKITPAYPKQHAQLSFDYNKDYSPLLKEKDLDIAVYQFTKTGIKISEPSVIKKGSSYTGSIMIDSNTNCIAFSFSANEEKDINNGKGYLIPVYNEKNIPVKDYYISAAGLKTGFGEYLLGLPTDVSFAFQLLNDGLKQYPQLKYDNAFFNTYLGTTSKVNPKEAPAVINTELIGFENKGKLTEQDYGTLIQWYTNNKRKDKVDSLTAAMKAAFPNGDWVKDKDIQAMLSAKTAADKSAVYNDFIKKYPPTEKDKQLISYLKSQIVNAYAQEKNYAEYNKWNSTLEKGEIAANNNNISWGMAEEGGNLEEAKKMAYEATTYAKNEMEKPAEKRPDNLTTKSWEEQRRQTYGMYGDTYAYILYKMGDYKTALPYTRDAATISKLKDAELNERYAMIAEKTLETSEAKKLIEQFVKDGAASSKTKEVLKDIYLKENKSETGFTEYLDKLEADAKTKKHDEIVKTVLDEAAPDFSLKDFDGKSVRLSDFKGKIVVVDFWATWCGPCIASMPGMNKAITKYKDNDRVKFLFVDTWENADDKLKNAKDFMAKKNYPFYVLLDNDNKMVEDFKVSGIPTKFIIDKDGKVKFKAVGFSGNDDALVDELTTMIEIAGK